MKKDQSMHETNTPAPSVATEAERDNNIPKQRKRRIWDIGNLFWGLLLIMIGTLFLLDNFDVIEVNFADLWRLWPLVIIIIGISVLSIKGWVGGILAGTAVIAALVLIALVATGKVEPNFTRGDIETSTKTIDPAANTTSANVTIKDGAGKIEINSADVPTLVTSKLESDTFTLTQNSSERNGIQNVDIIVEGSSSGVWRGSFENELFVTLSESIPLNLKVDAGASSIDADLSEVNLRSLDIDSGASDIEFKIGHKSDTTDININVGMSSVTLLLPKGSGVSMDVDSGMSSRETTGLTETSDGRYESSNFSSATKKINIRGSLGMANLDIRYY